MPIRERDLGGRAASAFDTRALYDVVRAVAEHANPDAPTSVSQRAWDKARAGAGYPDAPSARCITMRLRENWSGKVYPWRRLLDRVCDPETNLDQVDVRRRTVEVALDFTENHISFALRAAAKSLGVKTVSATEYELERERMLKKARRGRRHGLAQLLPTPAQIQRTLMRHEEGRTESEAWDRALELAGLEVLVASGSKGKPGRNAQTGVVSMPEAIHHYLEAGNSLEFWPTKSRMREFSHLADIRLQTWNGPWSEALAEAAAYRASRGLRHPSRSRPAGAGQKWEPIKAPAVPIPGAAPKRTAHWKRPYTDEELWAALERYDRETPLSEKRSQIGYRRFAKEHKLPSASLMSRIGGIRKAMNEIRRRRGHRTQQ